MKKQPNIVNGFNFDELPISITYCGKIIEGKGGWDHFLYSVSIGNFTTAYKCGIDWVEKTKNYRPMPNPPYCKGTVAYEEWYAANHQPKAPSNSDIMHSLLMDSEASDCSFSEWCSNFGYDSDSISAFNTYQECEKIGQKLRKVFTRECLEEMQKALEDY